MKRFQRLQHGVHPGGARIARRRLQQHRQHLVGVEREIVGLHDDHAVDRMALDLAQQLVGAALAVGLGPVAADEVAVVVGHQAGVGVDDDAARRIVDARQLVERHEARPVEFRRPARHRHRAVALAPDRHAGRRRPGRRFRRCRRRPCSASARRCGARRRRNSSQFCARPRRPKPSAEVSAPSSAVACSASTWPCGVRSSAAADEIVDHRRRAASRARAW